MWEKLRRFLVVVLGTVIVAVALNMFLVPSNLAPGGVSGLAVVVNYLTKVPVGTLIFVFNIPIFAWGLRHFSKSYMVFSLVGMFLLSVSTDLLVNVPRVTEDVLLSAIYGGVLLGVGVGLVFSAGCTTGGADIVAQILKKRFPFISVGRLVLIIDAFVVTLAGIVFGKWEVTLYSAVSMYISTFIIDIIVEGGDSAKVAFIISDRQGDLAEAISKELYRGTTLLHGSSFYSGKERSVLMCVIKKYEIARLKSIIKATDSTAFVIFSDAREVLGNGFNSY